MKKFIAFLLGICSVLAVFAFTGCKKKTENSPIFYDIAVRYDEDGRALSGTARIDYKNTTGNELTDLKFNLYGNAFREGVNTPPVGEAYAAKAYYDGFSYGGMKVESVTGCSAWAQGGEDENILTVNLQTPLYPDDSASVTVTYSLSLANINHRTGVTANAVNLGNFYPQLCAYSDGGFIESPYYPFGDPFVSEIADYNVVLDVPEGWTAAASGLLTGETTAAGRKKCSYTLKKARDFAAVISDSFEVCEGEVGGVKVYYYHTGDEHAEEYLAAAEQSLEYFSQTFGEYVYPTLSVVSTGFYCGGMEYPALTMINDSMNFDNTVYTIVHENAHQWWYAMVGSDQLNDPWQDEGLAEYSTLMFFENHPDYGFTRTGLIGSATRAYRNFFSIQSQLNGKADTSMTRNLSTYSSDYEYTNVTYNKGMILFDTLRKSLGDKAFTSALKKYYGKNLYKIASRDDICACFISSGTDVEGFFAAFLEGRIVI